jgi:hypothetical protein
VFLASPAHHAGDAVLPDSDMRHREGDEAASATPGRRVPLCCGKAGPAEEKHSGEAGEIEGAPAADRPGTAGVDVPSPPRNG